MVNWDLLVSSCRWGPVDQGWCTLMTVIMGQQAQACCNIGVLQNITLLELMGWFGQQVVSSQQPYGVLAGVLYCHFVTGY